MTINIHDLLSEDISDEGAYHLVNFFMKLATELDSRYFAQIRRYIDANKPVKPQKFKKAKKHSLKALAFSKTKKL